MSIQLTDLQVTIFECCYPVGSIYITESDGNPNTLIPGGQSSTWTKIENRMLIGSGSSYGLGSQGGEATHTLTVSEMPSHTHTMSSSGSHVHSFTYPKGDQNYNNGSGNTWWGNSYSYSKNTNSSGSHTHTVYSAGSSAPHNNLPPYRAVNIWRRDS